jgi:hypothetical protein
MKRRERDWPSGWFLRGSQGTNRRGVAFSFLIAGAFAVGVIEWFVYWSADELGPCFMGSAHGGRWASEGWAALIGLCLLTPVALAAFRRRRRLLLLLFCFAFLYGAVLVALWYTSPTIWGPERCTF